MAAKLTRGFLFHESWPGTAWRALSAIPELSHIDFELRDGATESISVHPEFTSGAALVASVFLEDGQYKALLEFTYRLGIKNVALVHLHYEGFELIFHGGLPFFQLGINAVFKIAIALVAWTQLLAKVAGAVVATNPVPDRNGRAIRKGPPRWQHGPPPRNMAPTANLPAISKWA